MSQQMSLTNQDIMSPKGTLTAQSHGAHLCQVRDSNSKMKDAVKDWVVRAEGSHRKLGCLQRNVGSVQ